jgi:hypothetical protein
MKLKYLSKGRNICLFIISMLHFCLKAQAQDTSRNYNIFKPVPSALMREDMETDRPDVTETPHTVDAGHLQYEADLVNYQTETSGNTKQQHWLINQANIKLGLLKNTDLQFVIQSYGKDISTNKVTGLKETASGFGDISVRVKQNINGNYHGNFSIAIMPYIKLPTNTYTDNQIIEGGLIVPLSLNLPDDWELGTQAEVSFIKDDEIIARHTELLQTLTISHPLFKNMDFIAETYYTYDFKHHETQNFLDGAVAYQISKAFSVDAGFNYGLQKEAAKTYFLGIAIRH